MAQKEDNKKKRSPKNRKKAMREGYLSFDIDEVKRRQRRPPGCWNC